MSQAIDVLKKEVGHYQHAPDLSVETRRGMIEYIKVLHGHVNESAIMSDNQAFYLAAQIANRVIRGDSAGSVHFTFAETLAIATYINSCKP